MRGSQEILEGLKVPIRELRDVIPQTSARFMAMHQAAVADGALPTKVKEAIALAIAVTEECDGVSRITPRLPQQVERQPRRLPKRSVWRCS